MTDSFAKTFETLHRQSFRMTINKVWNTIKEGHSVELNQEDQKLYLILRDHHEYQEYFENEDLLDGSECPTSEGFNPFLHISLHQMTEEQLASETPVEAALLCESIEKMGHSRHDAIHVIIMILIHVIFDAYKNNKPFDNERYRRLLVKCRKVKPSEMQNVVERDFSSN
jgi:predicted NAD-dependent protein-ADP-ribosyltransferase YbiA (DUF1768 family)